MIMAPFVPANWLAEQFDHPDEELSQLQALVPMQLGAVTSYDPAILQTFVDHRQVIPDPSSTSLCALAHSRERIL